MRLDDHVVIVTGGARGIGAGGVRLLAERAAAVVIADVLSDDGAALARELGPRASFVEHDVRSSDSWDGLIDRTKEEYGSVSGLINCAGVIEWNVPILELSQERYQRVIDVNQLGTFLGMKAAAPDIAERGGGSIVNISSTAGLVGYWGIAAYVASKFAVRGMSKAAAIEFGPLGIRVNSVHPGNVATAMTADLPAPDDQPIPRQAEPRELAEMLAFLISDASSYVTGAEFVVDGGHLVGKTVVAEEH